MILRQLLNYLYKSRINYVEELQRRRKSKVKRESTSIPSYRYGSDSENRIRANNTKLYDTYIKLKRFRRSNSFKILKDELMGIERGYKYYDFNYIRGTKYPKYINKCLQWFDDSLWYPSGKIPNKGEPICEGTVTDVGRGCTEPIQFYPREVLGLDDSFPDVVMLKGSSVIIPDPDSIRPINNNNFGDAGHPIEISFECNKYRSEHIDDMAKELLEKYGVEHFILSNENTVNIVNTTSDKAYIDIESEKPAFATRALNVLNSYKDGINNIQYITSNPLPNMLNENTERITSCMGIPAQFIDPKYADIIAKKELDAFATKICDIDECTSPDNAQPYYELDPSEIPEGLKLLELGMREKFGNKFVGIDPIPNSDAFSVRRLGKLTELKKGR